MYRLLRLYYKSQSALTPLLLLSKPDPLRWAPDAWENLQKKILKKLDDS